MKISVVTVAYNSGKTIDHTLKSFIEQDYPQKELIVIDGGSTDGTLDVIARINAPGVKVYSEPDNGIYDAMNKGLHLFSGDAVGFLNSDDRFSGPQSLSFIAEALTKAAATYGHLRYVRSHEAGKSVRMWRAQPPPKSGFRSGWVPSHPTFYCKRWVAEKVGQFDTSLGIAADYDWMLRAVELTGASVAVIDQVLVDMATGGHSTRNLSARIRGNLEKMRSRRKHFGPSSFDYALFAMPIAKITQIIRRR
jgi:glycosyltransferase involved in cell wall biosynthesis